jgi:hypothetical protein
MVAPANGAKSEEKRSQTMKVVTVARERLALSLGVVSLMVAATAMAAPMAPLGCDARDASARVAPPSTGAKLAAGPHAEGDHFAVDAALVGSCAPATECSIAINLTVKDQFHVNPEYPHKFTAQDTAGVEFLGKDAAKKNVFGKATGDFVITDPKHAVLTVRFKAQAGSPTIQGTLKIGVCSEQTCILPQVDLAVPVTVK